MSASLLEDLNEAYDDSDFGGVCEFLPDFSLRRRITSLDPVLLPVDAFAVFRKRGIWHDLKTRD